jgi:hypothetical protein
VSVIKIEDALGAAFADELRVLEEEAKKPNTFLQELDPATRNESKGSLYYAVTHGPATILVCDIDTDESDLVKECFHAGLPVYVEPVRFDPEVPRLEIGNITVVGTEAIKEFLATR